MGSAHTEFHCHGLSTRVELSLSPYHAYGYEALFHGRSQFMVFTGSLVDTVTKYS